jgi:hypothetical protein
MKKVKGLNVTNQKTIMKIRLIHCLLPALSGILMLSFFERIASGQDKSQFPYQSYSVLVKDTSGNEVIITIPPFAHSPDFRVSVTLLDSAVNQPFKQVLFPGVRIEPHNVFLTQPAVVEFHLSHLPEGIGKDIVFALFKGSSSDFALPLATEVLEGGVVLRARVTSFSDIFAAAPSPGELNQVWDVFQGQIVHASPGFLDLFDIYEMNAGIIPLQEVLDSRDIADAFRQSLMENMPGQIESMLEGEPNDKCGQALPMLMEVRRNNDIIMQPLMDRLVKLWDDPAITKMVEEGQSEEAINDAISQLLGFPVELINSYEETVINSLNERIKKLAENCPPKMTWQSEIQIEGDWAHEMIAPEAPIWAGWAVDGLTILKVKGDIQLLVDNTIRGLLDGSVSATAFATDDCPEFQSDEKAIPGWSATGILQNDSLTVGVYTSYEGVFLGTILCRKNNNETYPLSYAYSILSGPASSMLLNLPPPFDGQFDRTIEFTLDRRTFHVKSHWDLKIK